MNLTKRPEILAPAGDMEKLRFALAYGADAAYLGGSVYSLRAQGKNFAPAEIAAAVRYAHSLGKKIYVTVNIYPHEGEISGLADYFRYLAEIGADGALVSDLGVFSLAREAAPTLPLHVSTQANTLNSAAVNAWANLGATRVVLGREISYDELKEIRAKTNIELEIFVHGAMCVSYSGRCLLSNYLTGRDANRGACTQPCRWKYAIVEEKRPNQFFPVIEDEHGTYIFNSKDLCLIEKVPDLARLGIDSLKIEGRNKSVHYVATAANAYRRAVDEYAAGTLTPDRLNELNGELEKISHRQYCRGFWDGNPHSSSVVDKQPTINPLSRGSKVLKALSGGADETASLPLAPLSRGEDGAKRRQGGAGENINQIYNTSVYEKSCEFIGLVLSCDEAGRAVVEQRNNFRLGEEIELFSPDGEVFAQTVGDLSDEENNPLAVAPHPRQHVKMTLKKSVPPLTILRRVLR